MRHSDFGDDSLWVIDRIVEGRRAILQDEQGRTREIELGMLPKGVREGDALRWIRTGELQEFRSDPEATKRLREEVESLRRSFRRGPSGPVEL